MKFFYIFVVMAILLPLSIFARPAASPNMSDLAPQQQFDLSKVGVHPSEVINIKKSDFPSPQLAFQPLDVNLEFYWTAMFQEVTPFAYEPKSNTLVYVTTKRESVDGWADGTVYLHFSNNGGQSWTTEAVFTEKTTMLFFPSIAVLNPKNSANPSEFKYVVTVTPFKPRPTPNDTLYYAEGNMYLFFNGTGWENVEKYEEKAPIQNNIGGTQQWGVTNKQSFAVSSSKGDFFYVYGTLSALEGYQYGAYGLAYIDFTEDFPNPQSIVPKAFQDAAFRDPGSLTGSWNSPIRMGADPEGNVYAFVFNMFADRENDRILAFSKSVDNGRTFSDFQRMPYTTLSDFLNNWNHNATFNYTPHPYTSWGAVVTGVDEFSLFPRLMSFVGATTETAVGTGHYVEASYKDGAWQPIRRVAELFLNDYPSRIGNVGVAPQFKDSVININASLRLNEVQAAITADGNSIVLKYLDFPPTGNNIAALNTPVTLVGNFMAQIDSLYTTDIFVAHRNLSENTWTVNNTTQDLWYNKGTYIPNIVPSLTQIPIAEYITQEFTSTTNVRLVYPYFLQNMVADRSSATAGTAYTAIVGVFDAQNPSPINNPAIQIPKGLTTSVLENLPFAISDISPNPANDMAVLNFSLEMNADVTITLHNAMGQSLKTINVGNAQVGLNSVNILTNDLPAGAYFYTINVNGKTQTQLLNVIR